MYYTPFRLYFDSLRTADVTYSGLTPAQYGTLILFAIGFTVFMVQRKKKPVRLLERGGAIPYDGYTVTESESITN